MRNQNNNNYFDDMDFWPEPAAPGKQREPFTEPRQTPENDLQNFYDMAPGNNRRTASSSRSGRSSRNTRSSRRGNPLPVILAAAGALVCVAAVCIIAGLMGGGGDTPAVTAPPAVSSTVRLPDPATPKPAPGESQAAPAGSQPAPTMPKPAAKAPDSYRYFGRKLTPEHQAIYDMIVQGVAGQAGTIGPVNIATHEELEMIARYVWFDYPEYFWFRGGFDSSYYDRDTYLEVTMEPVYEGNAAENSARAAFVESASRDILSQLAGRSDYEKVKGVYEYLIDNTIYDLDYTGTTIYEMFSEGRGVCEGYARASQYLLTKLGVETLFVVGVGGEMGEEDTWEAHSWNIVKIDGIYYQMDATWGDPLNEDGIQTKNFNYLNLTDAEIRRRHEADDWSLYPRCTETTHNYYRYEGIYLETFDKALLSALMAEAHSRDAALEFKCADEGIYRAVCSWLIDNDGFEELFSQINFTSGYYYEYGYYDDMLIFSVEIL